jgi:hypothetical protein
MKRRTPQRDKSPLIGHQTFDKQLMRKLNAVTKSKALTQQRIICIVISPSILNFDLVEG